MPVKQVARYIHSRLSGLHINSTFVANFLTEYNGDLTFLEPGTSIFFFVIGVCGDRTHTS